MGFLYEVDNVLNLRCLWEDFLDLLQGIGACAGALVDDAVSLVDVLNGLCREAATPQADEVDACIADGLLACNDERRNVLREAAASLNHDVGADVAELMAEHDSRNDGVVVDGDLACKLRGVADDAMVSHHAVVGDVHVLHEQIVAAHDGCSLRSRTTRDGDVLANGVVVANLAGGDFALELQVLRFCRNACAREYFVPVTDSRTLIDGDAILKHVVVADDDIAVDVTERADDVVVAELCLGMDEC